jgi:CHRD domain-containing protein
VQELYQSSSLYPFLTILQIERYIQMKKITMLHIVLIALTVLALTSIAADGGRKFTTTLTGAAEAPGPGDPDGSGTAMLELNPGTGQVCFEISLSDIALPINAGHIHEAPAGVPGPVVIPLFLTPDADGFISGCVSADREEIKEIIQHPEEYYVNVHNTEFPAGAARGQLSK